jgi:hypothetical protein
MGLFDTEAGMFSTEVEFYDQKHKELRERGASQGAYNYKGNKDIGRSLGRAIERYNLPNSPEAQQMRDTETIMQQLDITSPMEVKVGYDELLKIGNVKGAYMLLEKHKALAPKATKLDTSVQEIDGNKLLINNQTGAPIKNLGKVTSKEKPSLKYLIRIGEGDAKDRTVSSKTFSDGEVPVNPKGHYWADSKTGGGSNVDIDFGGGLKPTDVLKFKRNYQDVTKAPREQAANLDDLDQLLQMEATGARDKAMISKMTQAFDGGVRALANLQQWRSLGDLGQRISGGFSSFFTGTMSEGQEADFRELIKEYKKDFNERYNKVKATEWDFAESQEGLNPRDVVGEERYQVLQKDGKSYEVDMFTNKVIREIK